MSDRNVTSIHFECSFNSDDLDSQMCPNIISRLQLLETESLALDTECLLQILEQCLSMCTTESLEEQVFRKVLPKIQHFLSRIVKAIDDIIMSKNVRMDDLDDVKRKLCICDGLLVFWRKCVEHVSTFEKVRVFYIRSLYEILPETIKIVFEHCKASRKYGMLLSGAMQELKNLFARAGAIFKLFATLDGVIVFDTDVESETELLTKVIDAHGTIASIANGMDTKTFVELSEAFAKLAITFQNDVKPNNIVTHLARMAKDVTCLLSTIKDKKDEKDKNTERNVAAAIRLLKILEKLTAAYSAFLTYKTMLDLVELSTQMHGCSCLSLAKNGERAISVSSASILDIILNHDDFKQAYFEYGTQIVSNDEHAHQLNYHLLTIAIMKKLNGMPYKHHYIWSLSSDSILDVAFTYIGYQEICVGELRLPVTLIDEQTRLVGIYEATLVPVCDLINQIPPEDFHALELLLLKHLLSGRFWSSLLSSDVWCFIGRLGTSQLCVDHIKYLIKVSATLVERRGSIEAIMINNMIVRLYELLTENAKSTLLDSLVDLDMYHHAPILHLLIVKTKAFSLERLRRKLEDLPTAYSDLQEHPSTRNWKCFIEWVFTVSYDNNKDVIEALTKICNFMENAITECEGKQLDILTDLIIVLLDATHLGSFQDDSRRRSFAILMFIATSCIYLPPRGKIKICHFLQRCVENLDDREVRKVATILTRFFSLLLDDDNLWVRQETLETFKRVGHVCSEELVVEIVKPLTKIPSISNVVQAYLSSRSYYVLKSFANAQDYLRYLSRAIRDHRNEHMCHEYNESEREEKMPRLETEEESRDIILPILIQLDEPAEKLYKELMKVLEGRAVISDTVCTKLITILEKIQRAYVK